LPDPKPHGEVKAAAATRPPLPSGSAPSLLLFYTIFFTNMHVYMSQEEENPFTEKTSDVVICVDSKSFFLLNSVRISVRKLLKETATK
jgi:hypothetical protein